MDYHFGTVRLLGAARECWIDGRQAPLPKRVFDILMHLVEHRDRAVGRDELAEAVWGHADVSDAQIGQVVLRARRAVGDDGQLQRVIRTVPGFGYRWVMPVETRAPDPVTDEPMSAGPDDQDTVIGESLPPRSPDAGTVATGPPLAAPAPVARVRPRRWIAAAVAVLLAIGVIWAWMLQSRQPLPSTDVDADVGSGQAIGSIHVLPVDVEIDAGDPVAYAWIRLGVMDLVADRLRGAGLPVPSSEAMLALRAVEPDDASGDRVGRFRTDHGVAVLIRGRALLEQERWHLLFEVHDDDGVDMFRAVDADVIAAAERVAADLTTKLGGTRVTQGTVADGLEQRLRRIQAALLANDFVQAREIVGALPASDLSRPQVRFRMAQLEFRTGGIDRAKAILDELVPELSAERDAELLGQALRTRGSVHSRLMLDAEAEADYDEAVRLLHNGPHASELGWALNGRGVARMILGRHDEAAADLGRGRVELTRVGDRHGVLSVDNNLGLLEFVRLRPTQAIAHSGAAAEQFQALGAINEAAAAQSIVIEAHRVLLQWSEALAVSDRGYGFRDRLEDADYLMTQDMNRTRILLGMGRDQDAIALLDGIESRYPEVSAWNREVLHALRADIAWRQGDAAAAARAALLALGARPVDARDSGRNYSALLLQRALHAGARVDRDMGGLLAMAADTEPVPVRLLLQAEAMAHASDIEQASRLYRAALTAAESRGLPIEIALVAQSYVPWLIERGQLDEASAVAGRVAPWAGRDYDCAVLQAHIHHARGQRDAWRSSVELARKLAGEREMPPELLVAPDGQADGNSAESMH